MLTYLNAVLAWVHAHPREALAGLLLLGWVANWGAGSLDALLRGSFSFQEWPRILRSQLASMEAVAVYATTGIAMVSVITDVVLRVYRVGFVSQADVDFLANRLLDLAAGAAGLYAAAIWHEVIRKQLPDIYDAIWARLRGNPHTIQRNVPKVAPSS